MCTLINLYNEWKNTKLCALSQFLCEQLCVSPLANVDTTRQDICSGTLLFDQIRHRCCETQTTERHFHTSENLCLKYHHTHIQIKPTYTYSIYKIMQAPHAV